MLNQEYCLVRYADTICPLNIHLKNTFTEIIAFNSIIKLNPKQDPYSQNSVHNGSHKHRFLVNKKETCHYITLSLQLDVTK